MIEPWTSQPTIIDIVTELFEDTIKLVETPSSDVGPSKAKEEAKTQLPELAGLLFATYQERLDWLGRFVIIPNPGGENRSEGCTATLQQLM